MPDAFFIIRLMVLYITVQKKGLLCLETVTESTTTVVIAELLLSTHDKAASVV
jgi:hypothetical protein